MRRLAPLLAAAAAAAALAAPSLAHLSGTLLPGRGAAACWELRATRILVDAGSPVVATGTRCASGRLGRWSWRGVERSPAGETAYRWTELVRADGRPTRLRFAPPTGSAVASLERQLPGSRDLVLGHLDLITVRLSGGALRYSLHGEARPPVRFAPART